MKRPIFRSLAEQFYLGRIAIENNMDVEKMERFLLTMVAEGLTRFVSGSIIHIVRTRDPDITEARHCYDRTKPVYKLSVVLQDSVKVENISKVYNALYNALIKLPHPELRELAIRNIDFDYAMDRVSPEAIMNITEPETALQIAFNWQQTHEGVAFWSGVEQMVSSSNVNVGVAKTLSEILNKMGKSPVVYVTVSEICDKFGVPPERLIIV